MGNFLFDVIRDLLGHEVDFVLCGGLACVLHGSERTTFDIDIHISMESDNLERLIEFAKKNNMSSRIPEPLENLLSPEKREEWLHTKGALVYTLMSNDGLVQVDVFLDYPIPFSELVNRAVIFEAEGLSIPVASMADMLKAKEHIAEKRPQDLQDIEFLKGRLGNG